MDADPSTSATAQYMVPKVIICGICKDLLEEPPKDHPDEKAFASVRCGHVFHTSCYAKYYLQLDQLEGKNPSPRKKGIPCAVCNSMNLPGTFQVFFSARNDDDPVPNKMELISLREYFAQITEENEAAKAAVEFKGKLLDAMDKEIEELQRSTEELIKERDDARRAARRRRRCFIL